ncbi:MAG: MerR family transcriptional regulator [Streptococcaceae bacterium]|jgi:MerR family glutamine synthetase transcriptional repressor|nr:MerR family transcriptional regulator [Streptococcaceae bacterium]
MTSSELMKSRQILPMSTVMALTDLTARQIRYYEEQGFVSAGRSSGGHRLYSLDNIDKLLEIKDYLEEGNNVADIRLILRKQQLRQRHSPDQALEEELKIQSRFFEPPTNIFGKPRI